MYRVAGACNGYNYVNIVKAIFADPFGLKLKTLLLKPKPKPKPKWATAQLQSLSSTLRIHYDPLFC
jgi:hypothetical protein